MKKGILLTGLALCAVSANAQNFKEGYVKWGYGSPEFPEAVTTWTANKKINEDDNFFISRVKPKKHFRNAATQVRPELDAANDKKLLAWVPVNNPTVNGLPDGVFDSEVFTMWPYVTHWGDWTAPIGRIPAGFIDAAHKNGVGVSGVASIPNAPLAGDWRQCIFDLGNNTDAQAAADFLKYYGNDGIGYNSEFYTDASMLEPLRTFHENLVKNSADNPLFENFWYDGTGDDGGVYFDEGLYYHNELTFGDEDHVRTSLFFNYNWNRGELLQTSVEYAEDLGRSPLDIYAGINMQGGEPKNNSWPKLANFPISIGLWGAHSMNMWWESRNELGSSADQQQRTYMLRTERYFTGGTRNPANCPEITSNMGFGATNYEYHGMSSMMSARSALKWNLAEEPFISYFNIGNGKFFNWKGVRQNNNEWANIGVQDYLPTWRWWFTKTLLGNTADQVAANGLDAEFVWDEAYVGGSSLRIFGSSNDEYLHLFKTEYKLEAGDEITVRYMRKKGEGDLSLILTAKNAEKTAINENGMKLLAAGDVNEDNEAWVEKKFTVGEGLAGKELALVALHFQNAKDLDLRLGEFSIVRKAAATPAKPEITSSEMLAFNHTGVDGKLIFNMANSKKAGEPCYNIDVNTSLFKVYAQQEGAAEPTLMGITTSWASLIYSAPIDFSLQSKNVRFGVSAVSLDMQSESAIAWTDYKTPVDYMYNDDIEVSKKTIKPGEAFELSYVDSQHDAAEWEISDINGKVVYTGNGNTVEVADGLKEIGSYNLKVTGMVNKFEKDLSGKLIFKGREEQVRSFAGYIQITSEGVGALPEIQSLTANDKEADIVVDKNEAISLKYTGRSADGAGSQAVNLKEQRFGAYCYDLGVTGHKSFTVSAWVKFNSFAPGTETQLLAIADKNHGWPKSDWGWVWTNCDDKGRISSFTFRGADYKNNELRYKFENTTLPLGNWVHMAYVFDYNEKGELRCDFYINGKKQECTAWSRANDGDRLSTGEPTYQAGIDAITDGQVLSFGGNAAGRSGIDGAIDNFMVWDKALTADEVKTAMGDLDKQALPGSLIAAWDLEDSPADGVFKAVGKKTDVKCGLHGYEADPNVEGKSELKWLKPEFTSGSPFVSGEAFPVVTLPTWKAKKGVLTNEKGNSTEGSATVAYAKDGVYEVTLTLSNSLGSDSQTIKGITVGNATGIESAEVLETEVTVENGMALVNFAAEGNYVINVYNAAGQLVAAKAQAMTAGQQAQIALGQAGVYVLRIQKDGKAIADVKLLNK